MASRDDLINTPRSGARPLFGGQPSTPRPRASTGGSSGTPRPRPSQRPRSGTARGRPQAARPRLRSVPAGSSSQARRPRASGGSSAGGGGGNPGGSGSTTTHASARRTVRQSGSPAPTRQRASQGSSRRQPSRLNRAASYTRAGRQLTSPELRNYQGIILAEFVLAEVLVAATPIATRDSRSGLSPYVPRDLSKLLAIGLLYFLLELMSVGGGTWGRVGAWFGGLVLLGVGLNEGSNIVRDLDILAGIKPAASKTDEG